MKLVYMDEAIEDLKCLIPFEILFSESTSFDTQFTPVPSSFCGYGIAWRVNDSNLTRRGTLCTIVLYRGQVLRFAYALPFGCNRLILSLLNYNQVNCRAITNIWGSAKRVRQSRAQS